MKIYVISREEGEYSDYRMTPITYFYDEKTARKFVETASARAREIFILIKAARQKHDELMEIKILDAGYKIIYERWQLGDMLGNPIDNKNTEILIEEWVNLPLNLKNELDPSYNISEHDYPSYRIDEIEEGKIPS